MRAKRAVIVGDPLQIEPVVPMPDEFTSKVLAHFDVDPERFNAPAASVQTLADAAGAFRGNLGDTIVGVPLPRAPPMPGPMFRISNRIAYDNQMVSGVQPSPSKIQGLLGDSQWFDVRGQGTGSDGKWCPEEADVVVDLLRRLQASTRRLTSTSSPRSAPSKTSSAHTSSGRIRNQGTRTSC